MQKPHPPIIIGGTGPHTLKRVADYADGWMPIAFTLSFEDLAARIAEVTAMAAAKGKPKPEITVFGVPPDQGSVEKYAEAGVDRAVWGLDSASADVVLPVLESYGKALRSFV